MYSTTIEDLYEAVEKPGGLTARMQLETLVADLTLVATYDSAPASSSRFETVPSPCAATMRSARVAA